MSLLGFQYVALDYLRSPCFVPEWLFSSEVCSVKVFSFCREKSYSLTV